MCQLWNLPPKWSHVTLDLQNLKERLWPCLNIWCLMFIPIFIFSKERHGFWFQHFRFTRDIPVWCSCRLNQVNPSGCRAFRGVWVHKVWESVSSACSGHHSLHSCSSVHMCCLLKKRYEGKPPCSLLYLITSQSKTLCGLEPDSLS